MTGLFLGVDGGGSGTRLCLLDSGGTVLAQASAPSAYYFTEGINVVADVLRGGVAEVCAVAGTLPQRIAFAFFGLPGYGESSADKVLLDRAPTAALGHDRYDVDNDMVCGWAGSLAGVDGINVIAGTGSMTYGQRAGHGVRVGGWGEVFGDEGSAYWVAAAGLRAFSRMSDGRDPVGPLHGLLRAHLDLHDDLDLIDHVLNRWKSERSRIARLCPVVGQAARAGDVAAHEILVAAGYSLAEIVETTRRRLEFDAAEVVPVSWSGGLTEDVTVLEALLAALDRSPGRYEPRPPVMSPAVGAAVHAAALNGTPLDSHAIARLRLSPTPRPLRRSP